MSDPVLAQRAKVSGWVSKALRLGSAMYVVASVVFFVGFMTGFTPIGVGIVIALMIVGSILLAPGLVFHYGVKAANRADKNDTW